MAALLAGCGGTAGLTADLRARVSAPEGTALRERAPDLVASVEEALAEAESAERAGQPDAAADHVTQARLLLDAAQAESVRIADEDERRRVEERVAEALERARRDELAREAIGAELARLASVEAAREEAERALAQAAEDEARPGRRARVALEDAADLRRAAAALRARARMTAAAAASLGAGAEALGPVTDALAASEQARADPLAALDAADRAHSEAQRALGAARRAAGSSPDSAAALAEAARAAGFEVVTLPEGLAVEADGLFAARGLSRGAAGRVERLAGLIAAHPHGPVMVQAQAGAGRGAEQLAAQRAEALQRALVAAGAEASRLSASAIPSALAAEHADRARLLFVGYAAR